MASARINKRKEKIKIVSAFSNEALEKELQSANKKNKPKIVKEITKRKALAEKVKA